MRNSKSLAPQIKLRGSNSPDIQLNRSNNKPPTPQNPIKINQSMYINNNNIFSTPDREEQINVSTINKSYKNNIQTLQKMKQVIIHLEKQLGPGNNTVILEGVKKNNFHKNLSYLRYQVQGLMIRDQKAQDFNISRKQIEEYQIKINQINRLLQKNTKQIVELQNQNALLIQDIKRKQDIIKYKHDRMVVQINNTIILRNSVNNAITTINCNIPQISPQLRQKLIFDLNVAQSGSYELRNTYTIGEPITRSNLNQGQRNYSDLLGLFRQFEKLSGKYPYNISDYQFQRIIVGFLLGLHGNNSMLHLSAYQAIQFRRLEQNYKKLKSNFGIVAGIYKTHIEKLNSIGNNLKMDPKFLQIIYQENINIEKVSGQIIQITHYSERVVNIYTQDITINNYLNIFALEIKNILTKYPNLRNEIDPRISEFFELNLIQILNIKKQDILINFLKSVPQTVKVSNIYTNNKIHPINNKILADLRMFIAYLFQQLNRISIRTGVTIKIDQAVLNFIQKQINQYVDIKTMMTIFKITNTQINHNHHHNHVIERIVEKPVIVDKIIQKIVEVEKIKQIDKFINVPIKVPTIVNTTVQKIHAIQNTIDKLVEVPVIQQKYIQLVKQVPKTIQIEKVVNNYIQKDRVVQVPVNYMVPQIKQVIVYKDRIVPVQKIIQKIVEVPVVIQRIIQKPVQILKICQIEKIVEKIIQRVQYKVQYQQIPYPQIEYQIVQRIIQKLVVIPQKQEYIIQVPVEKQKIVVITHTIQQIKQVQVFVQKIVYIDRIKQIQVPVQQFIPIVKNVQKIIQRNIEVPMHKQVLVTVPQLHTQYFVQRCQNTVLKQIQVNTPVIVRQPQVIEVQVNRNVYIQTPHINNIMQQKIVQVHTVVQKIKQIQVFIEKIVQKIVEVPKIVQIQKYIVVPTIVDRIVEVIRNVEKIVQNVVYEQRIVEVPVYIEVPVVLQRIVEVDKQKIVYVQVDRIVDRIVEKIVEVPKYQQKIITKDLIQERVVQLTIEVPKIINVQKIIKMDVQRIVQVQRQKIIKVQVPVIIDRIIEKVVPVYETVQRIVQVPYTNEKVVQKHISIPQIYQIKQVTHDIFIQKKIQQKTRDRFLIQDKIKQVQTNQQKLVFIPNIINQFIIIDKQCQKIISINNQITKIQQIQVQKQKIVEVPIYKEIQKPVIVNKNTIIDREIQKIVQVPTTIQKAVYITKNHQKIVQLYKQLTKIVQVQKIVQIPVIQQKIKQVTQYINHIQQTLKIVDKIIAVPYIIYQQPIHRKITRVPQVRRVMKYTQHSAIQNMNRFSRVATKASAKTKVSFQYNSGTAINYTSLIKTRQTYIQQLRVGIQTLLVQLQKMVLINPSLKGSVTVIQKYLSQFQRRYYLLSSSRTNINSTTTIQNQKVSTVFNEQFGKSWLIQKLIIQIRRLKYKYENIQFQLQQQIKKYFIDSYPNKTKIQNIQNEILLYIQQLNKKFMNLGTWNKQQIDILQVILEQRFIINKNLNLSNIQIQSLKKRVNQLQKQNYQLKINKNIQNKNNNSGINFRSSNVNKIIQNIVIQTPVKNNNYTIDYNTSKSKYTPINNNSNNSSFINYANKKYQYSQTNTIKNPQSDYNLNGDTPVSKLFKQPIPPVKLFGQSDNKNTNWIYNASSSFRRTQLQTKQDLRNNLSGRKNIS